MAKPISPDSYDRLLRDLRRMRPAAVALREALGAIMADHAAAALCDALDAVLAERDKVMAELLAGEVLLP